MHIYFFKAKIPLTEPDLVKAFFLQSDDDHGGGAEETAAAEAAAAAAEAAAAARGVEDAERQENEDAESYEAGDADFHYATVGVSLRSRPDEVANSTETESQDLERHWRPCPYMAKE
ncbi:hypothetical protein P8C59_005949 [Phyllachora maydis]|uniref:Uncharacterized protein n=1 Tax=Phyllachora maydis TaxID=1825666 RepID=A0AAD9MC14_9PEZI|nr:hypothetical protein P8C59_005949 [Phyllachora maydis]